MSMPWMLHRITFDEVVGVVGLDLKEVVETLIISLVVTTTNHVELSIWAVDALEVVWKLALESAFFNPACFVGEVDSVDVFGILLK